MTSSVWFLFIFFFKQKTAYEMRISDWSSDVCSSDLCFVTPAAGDDEPVAADADTDDDSADDDEDDDEDEEVEVAGVAAAKEGEKKAPNRSEERRVGKECVSTGRSRW